MARQSLYRRYRPRTFAQVHGQGHVVSALRAAIAGNSEGHAYLFSGPRGTGKTSIARIFAKALNCTNLHEGEPCLACESCQAIEAGTSYDLFELDAASHNGVDAMRELIARSAVGSPGRTKVYILDEVHMLSTAASNALLKTLEEPPDHVRFVLATTDPQKVLPTIRSRTQHFEFSLLRADELRTLVDWVVTDAALDVGEAERAWVVRQGRGSARDTLSALDQVVAAGGVLAVSEPVQAIADALAAQDVSGVLSAVDAAINAGREPRVLAEAVVQVVRDAFLATIGAPLEHLTDTDREQARALGTALGPRRCTVTMSTVGSALVDMRQAADPRIPLEVALIESAHVAAEAGSDASPAIDDLFERLHQVEREVRALAQRSPVQSAAPAQPDKSPPPPVPHSSRASAPPQPPQVPELARSEPAASDEVSDQQVSAWGESEVAEVLASSLTGVCRALYVGALVNIEGELITFTFPNDATLDRARPMLGDVQQALRSKLSSNISVAVNEGAQRGPRMQREPAESGRANPQRTVPPHRQPPSARSNDPVLALATTPEVDEPPMAQQRPHLTVVPDIDPFESEEELVSLEDLEDAHGVAVNPLELLLEAFPGSRVIEDQP